MRIEVPSYTPLPKQADFHNSNAFLRLYQGGFGSGKTKAGVWEAIDVSMAYPRNFGLIARKTYRELEDSTKKTFFDECPPALIAGFRARDEIVSFVNGSRIVFRSLDNVDKFRSVDLGFFYVDEASEVEDEDLPTMLMGRLRLGHVPWRGGWFTTNPSHVEHWLYRWFVERARTAPERYHLVTATSYENPYLPAEYVKTLEAEYSPQWARRYLMGEFGFLVSGAPVYENFNRNLHVVPEITWMSDRPVIRAWDFGFHRPAVLFSQVGRDGVWNVVLEKMGRDVLLHRFSELIVVLSNERFPGATFIDVGDPAGHQRSDKDPRTSIEILREQGIRLVTRRHPKKRLIELINQRLGMVRKSHEGKTIPQLQISRVGAPVFIEGLEGGYSWPRARDGRVYKEVPLEDGYYEHLQDCAQYTAAAIYLGGALSQSVTIREARWRFF